MAECRSNFNDFRRGEGAHAIEQAPLALFRPLARSRERGGQRSMRWCGRRTQAPKVAAHATPFPRAHGGQSSLL